MNILPMLLPNPPRAFVDILIPSVIHESPPDCVYMPSPFLSFIVTAGIISPQISYSIC